VTTALLWWTALLAITWGLVAGARAWRWSPEQADPSELRTRDRAARLALLPVVVLLALALLFSLSLLGWSSEPAGFRRLLETLPILAVCAVFGLGVAASVRTVAGRRLRSWWLLTGLLPAACGAAVMLAA
jgi:hypothetical protein